MARYCTTKWLLLALLLSTTLLSGCRAQTGAAAPASDDHDHEHEEEHALETAAAGVAEKGHEDHDHGDEHVHEAEEAAAATAAATNASADADDHEHEHENEHDEDHALETAAAAVTEEGKDDHEHEHEHAHEADEAAAATTTATTAGVEADHADHDHADYAGEEEHDDDHDDHDHAGHAHGLSYESYCEAVMNGEDPCAQIALEDYNLGLHIGSVFILLAVSAAGALLPVLLHVSSKNSAVMTIVKLGTYFGFGTILATAFIHMMLPAVQNLSSPCLPSSWNEAYEAWAYLFVTLSIVFMQLIDFLVEGAYQRYVERRSGGGQPHSEHGHDEHNHHAAVLGALASVHASNAHLANSHGVKDAESGPAISDNSEPAGEGETCAVHGEGCSTLIKHKHDPSQIVGIYMMEVGIIFHSVLIGITLGVTAGSAFITLLVALSFHQFFEGFAIGSAVVDSGLGVAKSVIAGLAYSITTPIGIAIGIGIRETFNQNDTTTLLVTGIFDSISTGILIYVVLVELIGPLMTQSPWLRSRPWWLQALSFLAFWSGVTVMAVIGQWV